MWPGLKVCGNRLELRRPKTLCKVSPRTPSLPPKPPSCVHKHHIRWIALESILLSRIHFRRILEFIISFFHIYSLRIRFFPILRKASPPLVWYGYCWWKANEGWRDSKAEYSSPEAVRIFRISCSFFFFLWNSPKKEKGAKNVHTGNINFENWLKNMHRRSCLKIQLFTTRLFTFVENSKHTSFHVLAF